MNSLVAFRKRRWSAIESTCGANRQLAVESRASRIRAESRDFRNSEKTGTRIFYSWKISFTSMFFVPHPFPTLIFWKDTKFVNKILKRCSATKHKSRCYPVQRKFGHYLTRKHGKACIYAVVSLIPPPINSWCVLLFTVNVLQAYDI